MEVLVLLSRTGLLSELPERRNILLRVVWTWRNGVGTNSIGTMVQLTVCVLFFSVQLDSWRFMEGNLPFILVISSLGQVVFIMKEKKNSPMELAKG